MAKGEVASEEFKELKKSIEQLTSAVKDVSDRMKKIENSSRNFDHDTIPLARLEQTGLNPWGLSAVQNLTGVSMGGQRRRADVPSKYSKTIKALESKKGGLTASQTGEITNRQRNTEATYLNDLYIAEIVDKERKGSKAYFKLSDDYRGKVKRIFGR